MLAEVQAANSLRGAALTQAAMFVARIREHYPNLPVTESHPKALLKACCASSWPTFTQRYAIRWESGDEHVRDAAIAAVAAREGHSGHWSHDLSESRLAGEQDPKAYWLAPIHYFWPER